jgi:hypothetical protein
MTTRYLSLAEIETGLVEVGDSPQDKGTLEMIVSRPNVDERLVIEQAELDIVEGLIGDNWRTRGSGSTEDGSAHPDMQITIMNSRFMGIIAPDRSRWPLAGDQLFIDLDLSFDNLSPGQRITIGTAVLEITEVPHSGCAKFTERYGHDAIRLVNSKEGRRLRRRGIYARVIQSGSVAVGDTVSKI